MLRFVLGCSGRRGITLGACALAVALPSCDGKGSVEPPPALGVARASLQSEAASANASGCADHAESDDPIEREHAKQAVRWRHPHHPGPAGVVPVRLLGINDFHGRLSEGLLVSSRPAGGAAVLASYLKAASAGFEGRSLIVHAGDLVGASPPESALLQDEPSIQFLNLLANSECGGAARSSSRCNVIGTAGNHEFDEGTDEFLRLVYGGEHEAGPFLEVPFTGARFPYVSANVVRTGGAFLLPPSRVVNLGGVRVGVIGAVLKETPTIVTPTGVAGLSFLEEATAINAEVARLEARGVQAIVVTIHQGSAQTPVDDSETDPSAAVGAPISSIVSALSGAVDVVVSGHSHTFTNALLPSSTGSAVLVTQAFSNGTAYAELDLDLDLASGDVVAKTARILTTFSDQAPGIVRDPEVQVLVDSARASVAPLVNRVVSQIAGDITRTQNAAGESTLGDLVADSQRAALGTDFAFMNPGGIRADLLFAADPTNPSDAEGSASWGELFTIQPFGNSLVTLRLTGEQVLALLEQQWQGQATPRLLQISGLSYTWDAALPDGEKIVEVLQDGVPVDPAGEYSATVNSFIAAGGDGFTVLTSAADQVGGPLDLDAFIDFLAAAPQPVAVPALDRISRLN
jgi:5'-nucleotidase